LFSFWNISFYFIFKYLSSFILESNFKNVFKQATETAEILRRVKNQMHRENYAGNPEAYYRKSIFIPFLDHYLDQLSSRFLDHSKPLLKIQNILHRNA